MKEKLVKNLDLKILAILLSIVLWLVVVNIDDPVKSVQFSDVPVQILNDDTLKDKGLVYDVVDDTDHINVSVSGRRSVIEELSKGDIIATADLKDIKEDNTIEIKLSSNKYASDIDGIKSDEKFVNLDIEELRKTQKSIQVSVNGEPASGYILGDASPSLNMVEISGPASMIGQVAAVRAEIDVDGVMGSINANAPLRLYDSEDNLISDSRISMNISSISVSQEILMTKNVPLDFIISGEPADGYLVSGKANADNSVVMIAGKKNVIDGISSIKIADDSLDISGCKNTVTADVDITNYLPFGTRLVDDGKSRNKVRVEVNIVREAFFNVSYDIDSVKIEGAPAGVDVKAVVDGKYIRNGLNTVKVYGLPDEIAKVNEDLNIYVDIDSYMEENGLTTLSKGTYWIEPSFNLPGSVHMDQDFKVQIKVS